VNTLLAGWAAGYVMAMVSTGALVFLTIRLTRAGELLDRRVARDVPRPLLAVPIFFGTVLAWTLAGLVIAAIYLVGDFGADSSSRWTFASMVVVLAVLPCPLLLVVVGRYWWLWTGLSALFALLFAGVMPLLASR
jgi:hypothetical protein